MDGSEIMLRLQTEEIQIYIQINYNYNDNYKYCNYNTCAQLPLSPDSALNQTCGIYNNSRGSVDMIDRQRLSCLDRKELLPHECCRYFFPGSLCMFV